ncbi:MAG: cytochrome c [Blastocatellia bacterium]|nr:cytochrome c [Blastocatellia bacterium]
MKHAREWFVIVLLPLVVIGGMYLLRRDPELRNRQWPTQMDASPAYLPQTANPVLPSGATNQMPVAGTIPRGFQPFHYGSGEEESLRAGRELTNPFPATPENLKRGEFIYSNYCAVCHGATGAGDGPIIPKYPNPPSYLTDKSRALADGTMYHVITMGRKDMPQHAAQLSAEDRWKVILHIRKLQGE